MEFLRENILKIVIMIVIIFIVAIIFTVSCGKKGIIKKVNSYTDIENNLVDSTKKYLNSNQKLFPKENGKISKINLDTLVNAGYIDEQYAIDDSSVSCSGYVEVINKEGNYVYIPYIKCGKYYETLTVIKKIISDQKISDNADGLYLQNSMYIFRGENPNNYLKLGDRLYRIIELSEEGDLKLISTTRYIDKVTWDDRYNSDINKSYGINDFSRSRVKDSLEYISNNYEYFSNQELEKIVSHDICIGKRNPNDLSISTSAECSLKYSSKIGMLMAAEYSRVSTDSNCTSLDSLSCTNYNYLNSISMAYSTLTASSLDSYNVIKMDSGILNLSRANRSFAVYPVVYIDKLSIYLSGDGTFENPYIVR